jgi:hypothetical protein
MKLTISDQVICFQQDRRNTLNDLSSWFTIFICENNRTQIKKIRTYIFQYLVSLQQCVHYLCSIAQYKVVKHKATANVMGTVTKAWNKHFSKKIPHWTDIINCYWEMVSIMS